MSTLDEIRKNAALANSMIEQLNTPADADSPAVAVEGAPADPVAAAAPQDAPAAAPVVQAAAPAVAPPPAGNTPAVDENSETFAQRWRTLQGVHNAMQNKFRESEAARQNLEQMVAQMQAAPRAPAQPRPSHLTDKDQTEYGAEMVEFVRRAAREEMAQLAQAVHALAAQVNGLRRLGPVVETMASTQVARTREDFYADLTRAVPDWKTTNNDPTFHAWLLEIDQFSGLQRDTLLKDAHDTLDLGRVVSIFKGFARRDGGAPAAQDTPAPAAAPSTARARLEMQVAPGRASVGTAPPQAAQKKQWTHAGIAAFYKDKREGKFKGREQDAAATERDIFDAQHEGRIVLNAA